MQYSMLEAPDYYSNSIHNTRSVYSEMVLLDKEDTVTVLRNTYILLQKIMLYLSQTVTLKNSEI